MSQNVVEIKNALVSVCDISTEAYRSAGKTVQSPAIRKVLESIIMQKSDSATVLRTIGVPFVGSVEPLSIPAGAGPEDILRYVVTHELAFATALDAYSASIEDEEKRQLVKGLADASRKFASWAKDHLDLLALF